jgi:hypothetical protein
MNKIIVDNSCKECGHTESHYETICDVCGTQLSSHGYIVREMGSFFPLKLTMGGTDYDFCDFKCILKFIIDGLTKEK